MTVFFELFEKNQNILQMNGIRARNHVGFVKKFQREVGQINTRKRVKTDKSRSQVYITLLLSISYYFFRKKFFL